MTAARWEYLHVAGRTGWAGYATAADRTTMALRETGIDVTSVPFRAGRSLGGRFDPVDEGWAERRPADVVVAHLSPECYPSISASRPGSLVVGHTAWETDRLPDEWTGLLDAVDLVVVPCDMNAQLVRAAGVSTPVTVIPYPVAPLPPSVADLTADVIGSPDVVTFYVIGEWTVRKGIVDSVRAFTRAFAGQRGVQMVVKTTPDDRTRARGPVRPFDEGSTPFALAEILAEVATPPPVRLLTHVLDDDEVAALHVSGDCYVSLCRGEGWGLGAFDAARLGTPVVTTGWSGHLDYLGPTYPHLVRYELVEVDEGPAAGAHREVQRWAEPDQDHAVELLRDVAADPGAHREAREETARAIEARCSPAAVAQLWVEALDLARRR